MTPSAPHSPPIYGSTAVRTLARARCRITRPWVSRMPSTLHTSSVEQPSTSRRVSTSRWLGGNASIAFWSCSPASRARSRPSGEVPRSQGGVVQWPGSVGWSAGAWATAASRRVSATRERHRPPFATARVFAWLIGCERSRLSGTSDPRTPRCPGSHPPTCPAPPRPRRRDSRRRGAPPGGGSCGTDQRGGRTRPHRLGAVRRSG